MTPAKMRKKDGGSREASDRWLMTAEIAERFDELIKVLKQLEMNSRVRLNL